MKKTKEIFLEVVPNSLKFESITKDHIKNDHVKKLPTFACNPVIILKHCVDIYLVHLPNYLGHSLQASVFRL